MIKTSEFVEGYCTKCRMRFSMRDLALNHMLETMHDIDCEIKTLVPITIYTLSLKRIKS